MNLQLKNVYIESTCITGESRKYVQKVKFLN
jgi:hypothetical protein